MNNNIDNKKELFKSNINNLHKVLIQLQLSQTMQYKQIILGASNADKLNDVVRHLRNAIKILRTIQ